MAIQLPPIPNNPITDTHVWRDWFFKVSQILVQGAAIAWTSLNFTGSNLRDIQTRQHNALQDMQGGDGADQYYHLTASQYSTATNKAYGAFSDYTTQTLASTTASQVMTFNTTDLSNDISVVSSSRFTVTKSAIYNFQWSGQFSSLDNAPQDVYVWIRINGTDVVGSTGVIGMEARKNLTDPYHALFGWNFVLSLTANDYVELVWGGTSTNISIKTYPAGLLPTRPSTASLVATLTQVN
jgi:hypothetical protein